MMVVKNAGAKKSGTDWVTIETEYVHGTESMRDIAARFEIKPAGVMARATKGGWEAKRKHKQTQLSKVAGEKLQDAKIDELTAWNAATLNEAKLLKAAARTMYAFSEDGKVRLKENITPAELSAAASANAQADRLARLALGVSTDNSQVTGKGGKDLMPKQSTLNISADTTPAQIAALVDALVGDSEYDA